MFQKASTFTLFVVFTLTAAIVTAQHDWRSGIPWKKPEVVTPGAKSSDPPSDAIVLFNGTSLSEWDNEWKIENGELVCVPGKGTLSTKRSFGSIQLHIEFATPAKVSGKDQGRGNSGVFFGPYEVQILDSYENDTYFDGQCASIYKQTPPIVNACRKPGEWQTYDIIFNRPELKIEDGIVYVIRPGYITVIQNGILVINRHEIQGTTSYNRPPVYEAHPPTLPIKLQDHGNEIRFRNIWVRDIPDTNVKPEATKAPYYL